MFFLKCVPIRWGDSWRGAFWNFQAVLNLLQGKQYPEGDVSEPLCAMLLSAILDPVECGC